MLKLNKKFSLDFLSRHEIDPKLYVEILITGREFGKGASIRISRARHFYYVGKKKYIYDWTVLFVEAIDHTKKIHKIIEDVMTRTCGIDKILNIYSNKIFLKWFMTDINKNLIESITTVFSSTLYSYDIQHKIIL